MGNLSWKIREAFRKFLPLAIVLAVAYGGYQMYRKGSFRHGLKPAIYSVLHKLPYFGSRFRHYRSSEQSWSVARAKRGRSYYRSHRRRGRRRR